MRVLRKPRGGARQRTAEYRKWHADTVRNKDAVLQAISVSLGAPRLPGIQPEKPARRQRNVAIPAPRAIVDAPRPVQPWVEHWEPKGPALGEGEVGLAVITYQRIYCLRKCLASLRDHDWGGAAVRVVIADELQSAGYEDVAGNFSEVLFDFGEHKNVAAAKNRAFRYLLARNCEHLFLMEDDTLMMSSDTCRAYIEYAKEHRIQHLNRATLFDLYAWHDIACSNALTAQFSYYTRESLSVGFMDEAYHNAMEHVHHTARIAAAGYTTPMGRFADVPSNRQYIEDIPERVSVCHP